MKLVTMITASHNPDNYNGIKIGTPFPDFMPNYPDISQIINSTSLFEIFVKRNFENLKNCNYEQRGVFIGMDKRSSSPLLLVILKETFEIIGIPVFNLGFKTTPQLFVITSFCINEWETKIQKIQLTTQEKNQSIRSIQKDYYTKSLNCFESAFYTILKIVGISIQNWEKPKIELDFGNGVGFVSFQYYQSTLSKYFQISCVGPINFQRVNKKLGAEYAMNHVSKLSNSQYDRQYFFDGDCDRIIIISQNKLIDGDDFNALFTITLITLLKKIKQNLSKLKNIFLQTLQPLKLGSVGNVNSNSCLKIFLNSIGVNYQQGSVGTINLYSLITKYDIGCYFQPCGHGNLYFSKTTLSLFQQISHSIDDNIPEVQLLLFFSFLCQNSSKGYALHNLLLSELCILYCQKLLNLPLCSILKKQYSINSALQVENIQQFDNETNNCLLKSPKQFCLFVQNLRQKYSHCSIIIRRSQTQPLLRAKLQGDQKECHQMYNQLIQQLKNNYKLVSL